ncbi:MAG: 2-oxoglutarate dehydrogenase complex dihydrolipoyllysine-residue succinyltransferase [Desulfuromonadaceae bacterium]|nr:2-oxoglutarate dehydrogenase complex dihydrolipoyllysine-residue succinyltransferase [Desulfuromonadaceae bacterium]MDD5107079.1 2-oxoglutarate dehydrogenase complex dihydrolipoyllysine-residue succinyltransferase [Desulfuromonadaceae bacterium]
MDIIVPEVGESVFEALVAQWLKKNGAHVARDEPLCELETDKITFQISAQSDGVLTITVPEGETVKIGAVIGSLAEQSAVQVGGATASSTAMPAAAAQARPTAEAFVMPAARKLAAESGLALNDILGSGRSGRVLVEDVMAAAVGRTVSGAEPVAVSALHDNRERRVPMTPIRRRIAEHLLKARQQTAMLTTFNEVDMSRVMDVRAHHKESFFKKHNVALGYMSFFVKACIEALREYPACNASIDGNDEVYHDYYDIGVAIGAEKGLVVPVLRNADRLHFHEVEQGIVDFAAKVKENRLAIADLEGGTFTISNGGVYGSLLSTPIINVPQSGVLGMHAIQNRPVEHKGEIVLRPMMYLAFSYDHRIIDGREAVQFLKHVKEVIEDPEMLLLEQ